MTVTPFNFFRMTDLNFEGGINMLGRKYSTETICYFDLVLDYMFLPQKTIEECVRMAKAFLLHLMRAHLFTNDRQMVFLRWLILFQDSGEARRAN